MSITLASARMNIKQLAILAISLSFTLSGCTLQQFYKPSADTQPASSKNTYSIDLPASDNVFDAYSTSSSESEPTTDRQFKNIWARIRSGFALDVPDKKQINDQIRWFSRHQEYLVRVAKRAKPYIHHIVEAVEKRNMPMEIALLPIVESGFQPFAYSSGRASGIWQFIPGTGKQYGLKQNWWYDGRRDILQSTRAALDYLQALHDRFSDWPLAIAAYNCGEGTVEKAKKRNLKAGKPVDFWHLDLPAETRGYLPRLLAISQVVATPSNYQLSLLNIPDSPVTRTVQTGSQIDLAIAARMASMSVEDLHRLNPAFNQWATAPDGPHELLLPLEKIDPFKTAMSQLAADKRVVWKRHKIRQGDSLIVIAKKYNTRVGFIKQLNKLNSNKIRAGQYLLVPQSGADLSQFQMIAKLNKRQSASSQKSRQKSTSYVVKKGDSLWTIARKHDVHVKQILSWNGISKHTPLKIGKKLLIKTTSQQKISHTDSITKKVHYTVRDGESLWHVSRRFQVSINDICLWNSLDKKKYLQPGQKILVFVAVNKQTDTI